MPRNQRWLLVLIFALGALFVPLSRAQDQTDETSHARIVRLSYIQGTVQLDGEQGYENVTINVPITEGDRLLTRSDGWAEVQFEDGSTLRLAPLSEVTFYQLARATSGGTLTSVDLDQGEAEFTVAMHDDSEFSVTARQKTILLRHSGRFRVTSTHEKPLEIVVFKGEVAVRDASSGGEVAVKKNETFMLDVMDVAQYQLAKGVQTDELDDWSAQREQSLAAYAAGGGGKYAQSPYQYGLNDLTYYGQYYDVAGYGYLWQPNGVGFGWDPFLNGYWCYSPIFGYTWVSAYPWGWMPYRFGNWVFISGRGWMWQPGFWNGWVRTPRLRQTPPGFRPPTPPAQPRIATGPGTPRERRPDASPRRPGIPTGPGATPPPRRVYTNDEAQGRVPRVETPPPAPALPGAVQMERKPAVVERREAPGAARQQPVAPGTVTALPAPAPPARAPEAPRAPVRAEPMPSRVPATPPPPPPPAPPRVTAPPAPRVETPAPRVTAPPPPPAPRYSAPPPAPRMSAPPASRAPAPPPAPRSESRAPGRGR